MGRLKWGLIGGGKGSQIGDAHRIATSLDRDFEFTAAALDIDPEKGKAFAAELGLAEDRSYGSWRELLEQELRREDPVELVTIATPNSSHYEIAKAFLLAGIPVLCEKPLSMSVAESEELVEISTRNNVLCAVNYGYTGYAMVRQAKAMIDNGDLGKIRVIVGEFSHGFHADASDADNPRLRWRYDPALAGVSSVLADAGIHALHMMSHVTGQKVQKLSAHFVSSIEGRQLEDDAQLAIQYDQGAVGRLWTSAVAVGQNHGLNIRIFGEKGGLRWHQEQPNQLFWTPLNQPTQTLERGAGGLYPEAERASRATVGHAEGFFCAFGNIYLDIGANLRAKKSGEAPPPLARNFPTAEEALRDMKAIEAAANSAKSGGRWITL